MISLDDKGEWFASNDPRVSIPSIVHIHDEFVWYEEDRYACPVCLIPVPADVIKKFNFIYPDYKYDL